MFSLSPGNELSSKEAHILGIAFCGICSRNFVKSRIKSIQIKGVLGISAKVSLFVIMGRVIQVSLPERACHFKKLDGALQVCLFIQQGDGKIVGIEIVIPTLGVDKKDGQDGSGLRYVARAASLDLRLFLAAPRAS